MFFQKNFSLFFYFEKKKVIRTPNSAQIPGGVRSQDISGCKYQEWCALAETNDYCVPAIFNRGLTEFKVQNPTLIEHLTMC